MGMLFNRRRQSQDAALRSACYNGSRADHLDVGILRPGSFATARRTTSASATTCADQAGAGELWFVEDGRELIGARGAEELVLYRWNRSYPGDVTFPLAPDGHGSW